MPVDTIVQGAATVGTPASLKPDETAVQRQDLPQAANTAAAEVAVSPTRTDDLRRAVSNLNDHAQTLRRDLHFSIDEESGQTVIKVINPETKEVIRQIPPEEVLAIAHSLSAEASGLILRTHV